ncbi:MAG: TIGR00645 family protein [Hydrotalea sp.]|nr:TIGR00645 family protein [Hydrotalea sp.]
MKKASKPTKTRRPQPWRNIEKKMEYLIFFSRWFQMPIYMGLVAALFFYALHFLKELWHLFQVGFNSDSSELGIMLIILNMVDAVLISNLLVIVIIGGWDTFVSRLDLENEKDQPDWLSHVSAWVLKTKLATAIVSITAVHLLTSFINVDEIDDRLLIWQIIIHIVLLVSAIAIALIARSALAGEKGKHN